MTDAVQKPKKAYYVDVSSRNVTTYLVFAHSQKEAREQWKVDGEALSSTVRPPYGVASVTRAAGEER